MIDPRLVDSPRAKWTLLEVLRMGGGPRDDEWSLALGRWIDEGDRTNICLAMRWNGTGSPESKGSPTSRGFPTWFIVPGDMVPALMQFVPDGKKAMVESMIADTLRDQRERSLART